MVRDLCQCRKEQDLWEWADFLMDYQIQTILQMLRKRRFSGVSGTSASVACRVVQLSLELARATVVLVTDSPDCNCNDSCSGSLNISV